MNVLLSSIGSRGDVQPMLALALELEALGHAPRLCVPPNFREWVESFGVTCVPIGPDVRNWRPSAGAPGAPFKLSRAQRQQLAAASVREQFRVLGDAARECDLIIAWGALQIAARSIAEALRLPYVYVTFAPVTLPSPDHPPPTIGAPPHPQGLPADANRALWARDARSFDARFRATLNEERAALGLPPVAGVRRHVFTERPWLAADPVLAPVPPMRRLDVVQTGAWLLPDPTPLPDDLERFLASGEPPIYFGFGSTRAPAETGPVLLEAARAVGRRAIVSRGWANLDAPTEGSDHLVIDDVDFLKLFPRVAAIVHHGGSGTTHAAALAGRPQVVAAHHYDQFYWARRVQALGIGVTGPTPDQVTRDAMTAALRACLRPETAARARDLAGRIELHGARIAAQRLVGELVAATPAATSARRSG